ncbi:MAG: hypothetical protein ACFFC7_14325 [Candidatus Hermodarchaeota archaeon]
MFQRTSYSRIGLFLMITILFFMNQYSFLAFPYALPVEGSSNDPLVILFDQGHGQFFNASIGRFSQAIEDLQLNNNTIVRFSNSRLNISILSGVDVLIITNPKEDKQYSSSEEDALRVWFEQRRNKGLFLLSNPYLEDNKTLSGNSPELKKLVTGQYLDVDGVDLRKDIIRLDSSPMEDTSILSLETDYSDHLVLNQTALVNRTITQSCSVKASQKALIGGREAYAEDSFGAITLQDEIPEIISLTTHLNTSRLALSGSTIMFSDLPFNSTHSWYELANNRILWKNIITWLGDVKTQEGVDESSPPLDLVQVIIAVSASAGTVFLVGFILHIFGVLRPVSATPISAPLPTQRPKKEKVTEPEKPTRVKRLSRRQRQLKAEQEKREPKKPPPKKKSRRQRQLDQRKKKER